MIVDALPLSLSPNGYTDVFLAVLVFRQAHTTVPGLVDKACFCTYDLSMGIPILNPSQEKIGQDNAVWMQLRSRDLPDVSRKHIPKEGIVHHSLHHNCNVQRGAVMVLLIESDTVREMT